MTFTEHNQRSLLKNRQPKRPTNNPHYHSSSQTSPELIEFLRHPRQLPPINHVNAKRRRVSLLSGALSLLISSASALPFARTPDDSPRTNRTTKPPPGTISISNKPEEQNRKTLEKLLGGSEARLHRFRCGRGGSCRCCCRSDGTERARWSAVSPGDGFPPDV